MLPDAVDAASVVQESYQVGWNLGDVSKLLHKR